MSSRVCACACVRVYRTTLTSEALVEYINDNFLIWGGDLRYAEPFRVSYMVGATTFPFFCVLTNVDGNVELLERIEGIT